VIVEQAPPRPAALEPTRRHELLILSAGSMAALDAARAGLAGHLAAHPDEDLGDVAYTLRVGRRIMPYRAAVVCPRAADPAQALAEEAATTIGHVPPDRPEIPVFLLFPGTGARRPGIGGELYRSEPGFRRDVDELAALFQPELGVDLRVGLSAERGGVASGPVPPWLAPAILFTVEYALARQWLSWGIRPAGLLGHGLGEWVAACLAGVFTVEDAVALVAAQARPTPAGETVGRLAALVAATPRRPPGIPLVSRVTGTWIDPAQATDPAYWGHPWTADRFDAAMRSVLATRPAVLLEVGPGRALSALVGRHPAATGEHVPVPSMYGPEGADAGLAAALGRLWTSGVPVDWADVHRGEHHRRVRLPWYPFQRRRHWVEHAVRATAPTRPAPQPRPPLRVPFRAPGGATERHVAAVWEEQFAVAPVGLDDDFFELGGDSLTAIEVVTKLRRIDPDLPLEAIFETPTVAGLADRIHHPDPR
jgi:acyl transferase domain-containing protein